jgi:Na+-transporting NADH:ubiquinone oxidoreductase subunit F
LYYVDEFDALQEAHDNFRWQPVLSAPALSDHWNGPVGNVHEVTRDELLSGMACVTECEFFVCGPPAMLAATRAMLRALGVPDEQVSFDDFGI